MEKIGKDIFLLGIISFFADVSSEAIMPILPFFIYSLGGAGIAVGLIMGFGDAIASISKVFSGRLSDKIGKRKIFMLTGYGLSATSKLFFPLSGQWWHMLLLRGIERIGKGLRGPPRDALIGDLYIKRRGEAYGIHRALDTAGAVVGSLLVLFLFWIFKLDIVTILFISASIAFLSLPPILFVKEIVITKKEEEKREKLPEKLRKFIFISTIFSLGNFSYAFFLLKVGIEEIEYALLYYAFFNIVYAILAPYTGKLSDAIGRKLVILLGYIAFTLVCLGFVFTHSFYGILSILFPILLFILYGVAHALIEGNQRALVSDLSRYRGHAQGIFQMFNGIGVFCASVIAGVLWEIFPDLPDLIFIYGGALSLIASILLAISDVE